MAAHLIHPLEGAVCPPALRAFPEDTSGKMKAGKSAWGHDNNAVLYIRKQAGRPMILQGENASFT